MELRWAAVFLPPLPMVAHFCGIHTDSDLPLSRRSFHRVSENLLHVPAKQFMTEFKGRLDRVLTSSREHIILNASCVPGTVHFNFYISNMQKSLKNHEHKHLPLDFTTDILCGYIIIQLCLFLSVHQPVFIFWDAF